MFERLRHRLANILNPEAQLEAERVAKQFSDAFKRSAEPAIISRQYATTVGYPSIVDMVCMGSDHPDVVRAMQGGFNRDTHRKMITCPPPLIPEPRDRPWRLVDAQLIEAKADQWSSSPAVVLWFWECVTRT